MLRQENHFSTGVQAQPWLWHSKIGSQHNNKMDFWKIQVRPAPSSRQPPLWTRDFQSTLTRGGDSTTRCLRLTRRNKENMFFGNICICTCIYVREVTWYKFEAIGSMLLQHLNHLSKGCLKFASFNYKVVYVRVRAHGCAYRSTALTKTRRELELSHGKLMAAPWMLRTKLGSFQEWVCTLNPWSVSSQPRRFLLKEAFPTSLCSLLVTC